MILIHISLAGCLTLSRMPHNPEEQPCDSGWPHPVQQGDVRPTGPSTSAPHPPSGGNTPRRSSRQDQLAELRMQMMHMQGKKKELEHNLDNCPNEALKNRFRAELLSMVLRELFCDQSEIF